MEIGGAAHNDFLLDTINVDLSHSPSTAKAQLRHAGRVMPVDVIASADRLPFPDRSYDFVLASHVLEHMPDPIAALCEWTRVAAQYVFLILPRPDNPFDAGRPLTTVNELVERHESGVSSDWDGHWSVWSSDSFQELCRHARLQVLAVRDPDDKRGNGFAVVLATGSRETQS